jgi:hypothetical protein
VREEEDYERRVEEPMFDCGRMNERERERERERESF